jgi:bifunctional UDP-N-acetylglucosamine pyrophosphorylase/glucosamine-1-phosphate N-acetyltransferase
MNPPECLLEPCSDIASVVILAAGQGKRMKSDLPKVLHSVCGLPMLSHVLSAAASVGAEHTVVVLGHGHERVLPLLPRGVQVALQAQQLGTGHALLSASDHMPEGAMLVLPGDTPLISGEALTGLARAHAASGATATVLTMVLEDPTGYGRVVRDADGQVSRIVEHRDASVEELAIREVNAGMYVLPAPETFELLRRNGMDNDQGELYLTDVVEALRGSGARVEASIIGDPRLVLGVNSRVELADAERILGERIKRDWMIVGVTLIDPASTCIEATVTLEADVLILPFTTLRGGTSVGAGSRLGPCSTLIDTRVGRACTLPHVFAESAEGPDGVVVTPFARLVGSENDARFWAIDDTLRSRDRT